ncbi:MAG: FAD-dependent monooxygenase [Rhizobiales bacterium]|nr:FAD-dependent monooxygenase [Hyphomicrobiales bacterium]MBI3674503.1 FAD-dependent monooxygenase [Hyphomicrobiales bacterium]
MVNRFDVIVIGAALNGLAVAVALAGPSARRPLGVLVVDAKDPETFASSQFDGRASAISASARRMFEALGIWQELGALAQPMNEIIVTDARPGGESRPVLLNFGETDMGGRPTAHMIENRHLYAALYRAARQSSYISFVTGSAVASYGFGPGLAEIRLVSDMAYRTSLIVAADGRNSPAREAAGIAMVGWAYDQAGIVVTVEHELPHHGRAEEHFTPSGPFAILPLPGNRSSLVWTEKRADAERIVALPDNEFLVELQERFGSHLGAIAVVSSRHSYPLALFVAREFVAPRLALVGDAAHVLHPLAGLGFNLGLRDAAALAECIADAAALGLDPGGTAVLQRYTAWRRFDTVATAAAMDGLNRLFGNDNPILRLFRDAGLMAVNRLPKLKSYFAIEAAGQSGDLPKLLRGELL